MSVLPDMMIKKKKKNQIFIKFLILKYMILYPTFVNSTNSNIYSRMVAWIMFPGMNLRWPLASSCGILQKYYHSFPFNHSLYIYILSWPLSRQDTFCHQAEMHKDLMCLQYEAVYINFWLLVHMKKQITSFRARNCREGWGEGSAIQKNTLFPDCLYPIWQNSQIRSTLASTSKYPLLCANFSKTGLETHWHMTASN